MAGSTDSRPLVDIPSYPIIVSTYNPELKFKLDQSFCLVGSRQNCFYKTHCINDESVSPIHYAFILNDKIWKLWDSSTSGTFVNKIMMKNKDQQILTDRDVIQFGSRPINTYMFYIDGRDYEKMFEKTNTEINMLKRKEAFLENAILLKNRKFESLNTNFQTLKDKIDNKKNSEELVASISDIIEAELRCVVCCDLLCEAVSLSCGHMICKFCICKLKTNAEREKLAKSCPLCRKCIKSEAPAYAVNSVLTAVIPKLSEDVKAARYRVLLKRGTRLSDLNNLRPMTEEDSDQ